jgi:NAD(P)-dependent dehydrogenase (short-subunit alcohol dehydrogenase family)
VRSEVSWIIEHHGIFQLYYYGDTTGVDKNAREIYRGHKYLIVEKNFVSLGIKCHLIPIMLAITLHILHRWFVKFFHGHHLTPALS